MIGRTDRRMDEWTDVRMKRWLSKAFSSAPASEDHIAMLNGILHVPARILDRRRRTRVLDPYQGSWMQDSRSKGLDPE